MQTKKIIDLARVIRSKNAGPFELTLDIIFNDHDTFDRVKQSRVFSSKLFADLYGIPEKDVLVFCFFDAACAIKATITRPVSSGAAGDHDVFGAQQHAPLLDIEIPWGE